MDCHKLTLRNRLWRFCLIGGALFPVCLALVGTSSIPVGRPISTEKSLTPLVFRQYAVNLRESPPTAKLVAPFSFWNRSGEPLTITKLEPSCGCLAPRLLGNRKDYPPGGQGLFEVQVETARETPGPHQYSIQVRYTTAGQEFTELVTFSCQIPQRNVAVVPSELYFYQLSNAPLQNKLSVQDHRGKTLKVISATSTSPYLKLGLNEPEESQEGTVETIIDVEVAPNVPPGAHHNFITIRTDDEDFPSLNVPVFLQGKPSPVKLTSGSSKTAPEMGQQKNSTKNRQPLEEDIQTPTEKEQTDE